MHSRCLFVHGWMVTGRVWDELTKDVEGAVAPTFAPEGSPTSETLETLADRVIAAADEAALERFHLVGHSMGGQIAQLVAARAKGRLASLALVNAVPLGGLALPADVASAFRSSGGNRAAQGAILDQACCELTTDAKERLLDDAGTIAPAWIARSLDLFVAGADAAALSTIDCPTLVVATSDPFLPPALLEQQIVSRISGAKLTTIAGPGHYPQVERPGALLETLRSFWR